MKLSTYFMTGLLNNAWHRWSQKPLNQSKGMQASTFGGPVSVPESGGLFSGLTKRFSGAEMMNNLGGSNIIMTIGIAIAVIVVVLIVDLYYPFLPINPVSGPSPAARQGKRFWTSVDANTENLIVPVAESPTTNPSNYTVSVEVLMTDSRTPDLGKFRQILHRGANPCQLSVSSAGPSGHAGIQLSDLPPNTDPNYVAAGLPSIMNPGVFLDPYRNDIHIFVHTQGLQDGVTTLWLESMTITDLPLNTPLTLGIVCSGKQLEVYTNCKLYGTMMLKGKPFMPSSANQWFGRYGVYPMAGTVQNLQVWGSALAVGDYVPFCNGSAAFGDKSTASCPTATQKQKTLPVGVKIT